MEIPVTKGDLVISIAGRDKGKTFLVVNVENGYAFIVDGRYRKVNKPKRKKIKHLTTVLGARAADLADEIQSGKPVGNERIYRTVKAEQEKI